MTVDDLGKLQHVTQVDPADNPVSVASIATDAVASATAPAARAFGYRFNGATWDRQRGNEPEVTLLASAARTALTDSPTQTNYNGRGVLIRLIVSVAGTGTLAVIVSSPVGGWNLHAFAGVSDSTSYLLYPGVTAGAIQRASAVLPRAWSVRVTPSDGSSWTYSVVAQVVL